MVEVGEILEGKVTGLTNFGAFISLPGNLTGMVHISEVSQSYVSDIHEHLKENQTVKVKVIDITPEGKISLSIKKHCRRSSSRRVNVLSAKIRGTETALPTFGRVSRQKRRTVLCLLKI